MCFRKPGKKGPLEGALFGRKSVLSHSEAQMRAHLACASDVISHLSSRSRKDSQSTSGPVKQEATCFDYLSSHHIGLSQQAKLDFTYGKFSAAAENYLLDTCGLELAQYKPYTGRGEIPNLSLKAVVPPNKVGSYYKDSTLTYFSTLQARVVEMLKLKNSHNWGRTGNHKQWLIVATWVSSQGAHIG